VEDLGDADLAGDLARPWSDKTVSPGVDASFWSAWGDGTGNVIAAGDDGLVYRSSAGGAFAPEPSTKPAATPNLLSISAVAPGPPTNPMYLAGAGGTIWAYSGNLAASTGEFAAEPSGTTNPLYGMWVAPDGVAFTVGYQTALKRMGTGWVPVTGPAAMEAAYSVWGVKTASAYAVYAVGAAGKIWYSSGGNFALQPSGTTNALYGVWGSAANDIYAVGDIGTILHSTGDGTWTKQNSGTAVPLEGIGGAGPSEIYIAGDNGTILYKYDAAATIWDKAGLPDPTENRDFFGVWAHPTAVFIVGEKGAILTK
jgi:hypothetical protein